LVVTTSNGVTAQLLASKTGVAPLKQTIPRLELLAALTLAKLMKSVSDSLDGVLKIDEIICWSIHRLFYGGSMVKASSVNGLSKIE
jgi:hypothetical protein